VLTEIYAAGEPKIPGVESTALVDAIRAHGHRGVQLVRDLDRVVEVLVPELRDGDMVITLGAGNVSMVGPQLLAVLEASRA
jgi:UDP-N-acetylmuramate--alanine ligase